MDDEKYAELMGRFDQATKALRAEGEPELAETLASHALLLNRMLTMARHGDRKTLALSLVVLESSAHLLSAVVAIHAAVLRQVAASVTTQQRAAGGQAQNPGAGD